MCIIGDSTTGGWDGGSELEKGRGECQKEGGRGERNGGMGGMGKVEKDGDRRAERMGKKEGQVGKDAEGGLDRLESGVRSLDPGVFMFMSTQRSGRSGSTV